MKQLVISLIVVLAAGLVAAPVSAWSWDEDVTCELPPPFPITICHAMEVGDPYERLVVYLLYYGLIEDEHQRHTLDIIPPYATCRDQYFDLVFEGQNWTPKGQAIWENGCVVEPTVIEKEVPVEVIREVPVERVVERVVEVPAPPPPDVYAPTATIIASGRRRISVLCDNSASTLPAICKVIYTQPGGLRTVKRLAVAPGAVHVTKPIAVRGIVRVRDAYQTLLARTP